MSPESVKVSGFCSIARHLGSTCRKSLLGTWPRADSRGGQSEVMGDLKGI